MDNPEKLETYGAQDEDCLFDGVYTTQSDIVLDATMRKTNKYDVNNSKR
jgi:hypothetical protein